MQAAGLLEQAGMDLGAQWEPESSLGTRREREAGGPKVQDHCLQDGVGCPGPHSQV